MVRGAYEEFLGRLPHPWRWPRLVWRWWVPYSYRLLFGDDALKSARSIVVWDLQRYTYAERRIATWNRDAAMRILGRREVYLHVKAYANMDPEELEAQMRSVRDTARLEE